MKEEQFDPLNMNNSNRSDTKSSFPPMANSYAGESSQSYIMEEKKHETLNIDTSSKSDEKSSPPTTSTDYPGSKSSSQSEIMEKEQQELLDVDISDESNGTLSSSFMPTDSPGESSQLYIIEEEKEELFDVDNSDESDETSSSSLMSTDSPEKPCQSYIIKEEKHETPNIDTFSKSDEKPSSPSTSTDSPGEPSQSEIMEKEQQKLHHVDISGESDEKSSPPPTSTDYAGSMSSSQYEIMEITEHEPMNIDTSSSSDEKSSCFPALKGFMREPFQSKTIKGMQQMFLDVDFDMKRFMPPSQSAIMEIEKHEPINIDTFSKSDEKLSSIPTLKGSIGEFTQSKIMEERQHELLNVNTSGKSDEKLLAPSTSNDFDGVPPQSDMKGEKHKSLNDDTSAESDEKSLVLWRPIAPPIQDLEAKLRLYKLLMSHVFTRESCLIFNYERERRSNLSFTTPDICSLESTPSEFSDVTEEPNTSKFDLNQDSQFSKKCIFTKQAALKTPKDSTNESNSSTDDEPYIDAEQSTHSATHTDDDIRNLELSDNQKETIEESPPECPAGALILVVSLPFVALFLMYLFPFYPFGLSLSQNLEHTDTFTSVIVELEEKILDHDETIRALAEYLQQDTPLLKVVALISNASADKSYTIDIIRNKFARRSGNEHVSLYPSFTVLENLSLRNFKMIIDFVNMCQKVYPYDQRVTILADFPINDFTHIDLNRAINTLKKTFIKANINIKILLYKPLNEETLEKYIQNMAENIGESFSQIQIDDIKRHLIEGNCKKAYGHCYGH